MHKPRENAMEEARVPRKAEFPARQPENRRHQQGGGRGRLHPRGAPELAWRGGRVEPAEWVPKYPPLPPLLAQEVNLSLFCTPSFCENSFGFRSPEKHPLTPTALSVIYVVSSVSDAILVIHVESSPPRVYSLPGNSLFSLMAKRREHSRVACKC